MSRIHALGVVVLALGLFGCGGGMSKSEFCEKYAEGYCGVQESCCEGGSGSGECAGDLKTLCQFAAAGTSDDEFDPDAAEACIAELESAKGSCDPNQGAGNDSACDRVFPEADDDAGEGESCENDFCGNGLYCDFDTKTCKRQVEVGGSCANDSFSCVDGAYCTSSTEMCEQKKAGGEACLSSFECASSDCRDDSTCAPQEHPVCMITFGG